MQDPHKLSTIDPVIFIQRRQALINHEAISGLLFIPSDCGDDTHQTLQAVSTTAQEILEASRTYEDEGRRFHTKTDNDFFWLTGLRAPGWVLAIDSVTGESFLIAPNIDEVHRIFDGSITEDEARRMSGIDTILNSDTAADKWRTVQTVTAHEYRPVLASLRALKNDEELRLLRTAVTLTTQTFDDVKTRLAAGSIDHSEYGLEAEYTYAFRRANARHAYEPIVAGGANALTLHYSKNGQMLPENGLVLLDIGAEAGGYCADITRTYAVGTPTDREIKVHTAVAKAHRAIIELIRPGLSFKEYHDRVDEIMQEALRELGLFNAPEDYRKYFPHAVSHGLGVDVHESLGGYDIFKPGMVLTVEPGIYIPEEGIGVRIEDDILVTADGNENLSGDLSISL